MGRKRFDHKKPKKKKKSFDEMDKTAFEIYNELINPIPILNREDEISLAKKRKSGNLEARNELVERSLKLVRKIAYNFKGAYHLDPEEFEDIIQFGNEGDLTFANKFDDKYDKRYSTGATWWITQAMRKAIFFPGLLRNEKHYTKTFVDLKRKLPSFVAEFKKEFDYKPERDELIDFIHKKTHHRKHMIELAVDIRLEGNISLYRKLDHDSETFLVDLIQNRHEDRPDYDKKSETEGIRKDLDYFLGKLPQREADVLRFRHFYFNEDFCKRYNKTEQEIYDIELAKKDKLKNSKKRPEGLSLESTGKFFNVTRERIRQIEEKAINKIRTIMLFDQDFRNASVEVKNRILSFTSENDSAKEVMGNELKEKIYETISGGSLEDKVENNYPRKGFKRHLSLEKNTLRNYVPLIGQTKIQDLLRLVYEIDDAQIKNKYKIPREEKLTFTLISKYLGYGTLPLLLNNLREAEETIDYMHNENISLDCLPKMRENLIEKYKSLAERTLANVKDETERKIVSMRYGLNGSGESKKTIAEISEELNIPYSNLIYKVSHGFKQLWKNMKLIRYSEEYKKPREDNLYNPNLSDNE